MEFSSAGYDLDAFNSADASTTQQDVVYEIGGGVSRISLEKKEKKEEDKDANETKQQETSDQNVMKQADEFKEQGNDAFRDKNWLEAYDMYTMAIEATPGDPKGAELLKSRDEHNARLQKLARIALQKQEQARREQKERQKAAKIAQPTANDSSTATNNKQTEDEVPEPETEAALREEFKAPPHEHGEKLAIFYCNRSACLLQLERYEEALDDCDIALLFNPKYTKAYVRRSKIHEMLGDEHLDAALKDAKQASELEPSDEKHKALVKRLEKLNAQYMERLKAETMDKLKDLGNSILGNFGLSLDNFKTVQDPNTGSYSISFDQSSNGKK